MFYEREANMKADISQVEIWAGGVEDRPGGLADKLEAISKSGAGLEFLVARRSPEKPGGGVVFMAPIKGSKQIKAAREAGFGKTEGLSAVRIAAADRAGLGAEVTKAVAQAGINIRGLSAIAAGKRAVFYFAFDSDTDAKRAISALKRICN
jgi:hypothetical protein